VNREPANRRYGVCDVKAEEGLMADQNREPAAGPSGRPGQGVESTRDVEQDVVNRHAVDTTPRRYEQPLGDDDDPVMPSDDSTLNVKI
jgi:hypothetical protein